VRQAQIKRESSRFWGSYRPWCSAPCSPRSPCLCPEAPLAPEHQDLLFVPASIATLMTGFLILTTRKKAISQVIGYLVLENGSSSRLLLTEAMR